jgi:hypothetical protein
LLLILLLTAALGATAWVVWSGRSPWSHQAIPAEQRPESKDAPDPAIAIAEAEQGPAEPAPTPASEAQPPAAATSPPAAAPAAPPAPQRVDHLLGALSPEDWDWLAANGFPEDTQFEVLMGMPLPELGRLAQSGDQNAASIADYRRLRRDPGAQPAIRTLFDRAVSGELFPLQLLAWHYMQLPDRESQVVASAYNRVLALRGYYNGLYSNMLIASGFSDGQRLASEVYTLAIYNDLNRARIERYGTPFPVNPRPGMEQLFAGAQAMIHETE